MSQRNNIETTTQRQLYLRFRTPVEHQNLNNDYNIGVGKVCKSETRLKAKRCPTNEKVKAAAVIDRFSAPFRFAITLPPPTA